MEPTNDLQQSGAVSSLVVDDFDVPLGLAEVGDLFGVAEGTTSKWHWRAKRGDFYFPKPDGYVSRSTPYWWESTMLAWGREVGRKTAAELAAGNGKVEAPPLEEAPEPVAVG